jgi:general secretion pathway protein A
MYLEHYGLKRKPFGLTPGPDFFWFSEKHKEALATLKYGIIGDLGFLLLTGEVGVGKTALIHRLMSRLDDSTLVAHITDPGLGTFDFFRLLAVEFGIDTPFRSKGEFLISLERFLLQAHKNQKKVLLIVDEAQRMNDALLDQVRVLSNIELDNHKLINIFFVGQPEFKNMLMTSANRAIRQRIAINYHVKPLTEKETGQYIEHRLKIAGATRRLFEPQAIGKIFEFSGGYPRAINIVCDHALLTGFAAGLKSIDSSVITESGDELSIRADFDFIKPPPPKPVAQRRSQAPPEAPEENLSKTPAHRQSNSLLYPAAVAASVVLVVFLGYYFLWSGPSATTVPKGVTDSSSRLPTSGTVQGKKLQPGAINTENTISLVRPQKDNDTAGGKGNDVRPLAKEANTNPELALPTPPTQTSAIIDSPPAGGEGPAEESPPVNTDGRESEAGVQLAFADEIGNQLPAPEVVQDSRFSGQAPPIPGGQPTAIEEPNAVTAEPSSLEERTGSEATSPATVDTGTARPDDASVANQDQAAPAAVRPAEATTPTEGKPKQDGNEEAAPAKNGKTLAALTVRPESPPTPKTGNAAKAGTTSKAKSDATTASSTPKKTSKPPKNAPKSVPAAPTVGPTAALQPPKSENAKAAETAKTGSLESRLRSFLQSYCTTYSSKDLDSFSALFAPGAVENGKSFEALLPKYQRNFTFIDTIYYRIELQEFSSQSDGKTIKVDGNFFLRWLPPDKQWRENAGKIYMSLQENGSSFLVQRLDYHGNTPKK